MGLPFTLGPPRPAELHALATMSRDLVEHGFRWHFRAPTLARLVLSGSHELVVARNETRVLGFAAMQFGAQTAHLVLLAVGVPYRRQGVATALLDWLDVMARNAGLFDVDLEVRASNLGAQAFYRKRGYQPVDYVEKYYSRVEDAVRMRADLRIRTLPTSSPKR